MYCSIDIGSLSRRCQSFDLNNTRVTFLPRKPEFVQTPIQRVMGSIGRKNCGSHGLEESLERLVFLNEAASLSDRQSGLRYI